MTVTAETLPDGPGTPGAMLLAARARAQRPEPVVRKLQRHRFGRRAATLPENQLLLGFEEVEQVATSGQAETEVPAEPSFYDRVGRALAPLTK